VTDEAPKRKRGRPRKGEIVPLRNGYGARVTLEIDGETVRKRVKLNTADPFVARIKTSRIVGDEFALAAITGACRGTESLAQAAKRLLETRTGTRAFQEYGRLLRHVFTLNVTPEEGPADPVAARKAHAIWHGPVTDVTSVDLAWILEAAKRRGQGRVSVKHIRNALHYVFAALAGPLEGVIGTSPTEGLKLPKPEKRVQKTTEVLEDGELIVYLSWEHPIERFREAVYQRQMMSAVSRMFGGLRTADLNVLTWDAFDIGDGTFLRGWAPRTKRGVPQRIAVPERLRPLLRWWWQRAGEATTGLLFPALRGERLGESRKQPSHAMAFRRDLMRAFGIEAWDGSKWQRVRELTERERALFLEGRYTEPVDFHSWRRAYVQAVEEAGTSGIGASVLSTSERGALSGHAEETTRQMYLRRYGKALTAPEGAMPLLGTGDGGPATGIFGQALAKNQRPANVAKENCPDVTDTSLARPEGFEPSTFGSVGRKWLRKPSESVGENHIGSDESDEEPHPLEEDGRKSRPELAPLSAEQLGDLLALASRAKRWDLVQALGAQLDHLQESTEAGKVASLDAARRRREEGGRK
jgi:integrase